MRFFSLCLLRLFFFFYNMTLVNLCIKYVLFVFYVVYFFVGTTLLNPFLLFCLKKKKSVNHTLKSTTCLSGVLSDRALTSSLLSCHYLGQGRLPTLGCSGFILSYLFILFFCLVVGISATPTRHPLQPPRWVALYDSGLQRKQSHTFSFQARPGFISWL